MSTKKTPGSARNSISEPKPARLKSPHEIAAYLAISLPNLYRLLRTGRLHGSKVGGQWRISDDAVRQFLEDEINVPK